MRVTSKSQTVRPYPTYETRKNNWRVSYKKCLGQTNSKIDTVTLSLRTGGPSVFQINHFKISAKFPWGPKQSHGPLPHVSDAACVATFKCKVPHRVRQKLATNTYIKRHATCEWRYSSMHSLHQCWTEVSSQIQAATPLAPRVCPLAITEEEATGTPKPVWTFRRREKPLPFVAIRTPIPWSTSP